MHVRSLQDGCRNWPIAAGKARSTRRTQHRRQVWRQEARRSDHCACAHSVREPAQASQRAFAADKVTKLPAARGATHLPPRRPRHHCNELFEELCDFEIAVLQHGMRPGLLQHGMRPGLLQLVGNERARVQKRGRVDRQWL
eukprot:355442-Chlamydomonas_euryale.AAC.1